MASKNTIDTTSLISSYDEGNESDISATTGRKAQQSLCDPNDQQEVVCSSSISLPPLAPLAPFARSVSQEYTPEIIHSFNSSESGHGNQPRQKPFSNTMQDHASKPLKLRKDVKFSSSVPHCPDDLSALPITGSGSRTAAVAGEASSFISRLGIMNDALFAADNEENLPDHSSALTNRRADPRVSEQTDDEGGDQEASPDVIFETGQRGQPGRPASETIWEMNYHEAAIYIQEGADNDKFDSHPSQRSALPAYLLTHSPWFYALDLFASLLLLSLAVVERPALEAFKDMNDGVHATVELFALAVLGISIILQLKWLGWKKFVRHTRSMMKCSAWVVMVAEAITVIVRNTSHFRATRALRPIFLLDNRYLGGVRRFMRQLLQSVPPVLEVVAILMLVLVVFTTLGYYLFSPHEEDPYFRTLPQSFVSLFVLLTTANFPDVMMPSYARSHWNAAFFIVYLAITLYCIMNFMLAIVFVVFSGMEKDKFRKLLLHKRRACQLAFRLLVSRSAPNHLTYANFAGLLKYYAPKTKVRDVYLIFKALNKSGSGRLSLNEFYQIYTACGLVWRPSDPEPAWYSHLPWACPATGAAIRKMVTSPVWEAVVYLVICSNGVTLLVLTLMISATGGVSQSPHVTWYQLTFIAFYSCEVLLKLIGLGMSEYMSSGWNVFDFVVTTLSIAGVLAETFGHAFYYIVILRPLRLLRLFRIRRRYREVFETLALLAPRVFSACVVITVIYYFFAIIGMEIFSHFDLKNCCVNSTVEQYYHADNNSLYQNYYYLNNFDNLFMAGVTLFELTVVNNWFIIMEGYAYVSGEWSRVFFMLFYLAMMVVMSVVLAFIIEAFTFRMQYNQTVNKNRAKPKSEVTRIQVTLTAEEVEFVYRDSKETRSLMQLSHDRKRGQSTEGTVHYWGIGTRSKTALQLRMYRHLLHTWIRDSSSQRQQSSASSAVRDSDLAHQNHHVRRRRRTTSSSSSPATNRANREEGSNEQQEEATAAVATRVTVDGATQLVDMTPDTSTWSGRLRQNSVASNLMEWWREESGVGDNSAPDEEEEEEEDEEDEDVEGQKCDPIWGIEEEEVLSSNVRRTSTGSLRRSATGAASSTHKSAANVIFDSLTDNSSPNFVSVAFASPIVTASDINVSRPVGGINQQSTPRGVMGEAALSGVVRSSSCSPFSSVAGAENDPSSQQRSHQQPTTLIENPFFSSVAESGPSVARGAGASNISSSVNITAGRGSLLFQTDFSPTFHEGVQGNAAELATTGREQPSLQDR